VIRATTMSLDVFPLCLGGNVFGWTADEAASFELLDAYVAAGGNFIDTADSYSMWVEGNSGGESETIIGRWMQARGNRDELVIATKVGQLDGNLSASTIRDAAKASLERLQTDRIDVYYAHIDDADTPLTETLGAFDALVRAGVVGHLGACGYGAERLAEALAVSDAEGLARYEAVQVHHNLLERRELDEALSGLCLREGVAVFPYFGLARGFLTGKYRPGRDVTSPRGGFGWTDGFDARSLAVLDALDEIAAAHSTTVAAVSLAWLRAQPGIAAPLASARTVDQLEELLPSATLELDEAEVGRLTALGA
jgi:aryl-alcohol dehydrogenase (NADP+)